MELSNQGAVTENLMLRLYGPLEPWFDKTWRPWKVIYPFEKK